MFRNKRVPLSRPIPIELGSQIAKSRRDTRTTRATTPESPILIQDGDNGNEGVDVNVRIISTEQKKGNMEEEKGETAKSSSSSSNRTHRSAQYISFELLKVTGITSYSKEISISDPIMEVFFRTKKLNILSNDPSLNIQIPYHSIKVMKLPRPSSGKRLVTVLLELRNEITQRIKGKSYPLEKVLLQFRKTLDLRQLKQIKILIGEDCLYSHFDSGELIRYFELLAFEPTKSEKFYGSGKFTASTSASSMKTDFSSLDRKERKERSHRAGSQIRYKNEDLEDEKANEQMLFENGETVINDYISSDDQLILEPDLKYKFDNKKTFTITNDDFKCLYNGNWINDTLVDFFLSYYLKQAREKKIPKTNNIEILNSFFFTSLSRPIESGDYYQNVKSWFKMNDTLFDRDFVIIPIMQDLHWYFIVITDLKLLKKKHMRLLAEKELKSENGLTRNNMKNEIKEEAIEDSNYCIPDSNPEVQSTYQDTQSSVIEDTQSQIECNKSFSSTQQSTLGSSNTESSSLIDELVSDTNDEAKKSATFADANSTDNFEGKLVGVAHICILDSLRRNHEKAVGYLKNFIISYAAEKYNFDVKSYEIAKHICYVPQQKNFNDCGLHLVFNVEAMLTDPINFSKVVLKRQRGRRNNYKTRKENELIFDSKRRLTLREDLRELLLKLLKDQVIASGEDASKIGVITAKKKRLLDLQKSKEHQDDSSARIEKGDISGNVTNLSNDKGKKSSGANSKKVSELCEENNEGSDTSDGRDDEDDDLVIVHANDKEPLKPDLELSHVLPSNEQLNGKPGTASPKTGSKRGRKRKAFVVKIKTSPTTEKKASSITENGAPREQHYENDSHASSLKNEYSGVLKKKPVSSGSMIKMWRSKRTVKLKPLKQDLSSESENELDVNDSKDKQLSGKNIRTYRARRNRTKPVSQTTRSPDNESARSTDILSQDSHCKGKIDDSPIKLLESDYEHTDIGAEIDRELHPESQPVSASSSQPKTSSKKLIDLVDVELNTSRYNTPLSPINLRSEKGELDPDNNLAPGNSKPLAIKRGGKLTAELIQASRTSDEDKSTTKHTGRETPEETAAEFGDQMSLRLTTKVRDLRIGIDPNNAIAIDDDNIPLKEHNTATLVASEKSKDLSDISPLRIGKAHVGRPSRSVITESKKDADLPRKLKSKNDGDSSTKPEVLTTFKSMEPVTKGMRRPIFGKKSLEPVLPTSRKINGIQAPAPRVAGAAAVESDTMKEIHACEPKDGTFPLKPAKRNIDSVDLTGDIKANKRRTRSRSASPKELLESTLSSISPSQIEAANGGEAPTRRKRKNIIPTERRLRSMSPRIQQGTETISTDTNSVKSNSQSRSTSRADKSRNNTNRRQAKRGASVGSDINTPSGSQTIN